ncbi:response regulator transcription factor [Luteococcus sp. Sow4_B9]|uniref:response regulator transcription factor n=1 Tax=Luteococcus sp. Sow4_B9 TaxID=3438792 RepID=UPI003F969694
MRLLLVEDDRSLAEVTRRGLASEGHVVDLARDGKEGCLKAVHGEYDVVILDIMLPLMNGYDILKQMRAEQVWTPVLMLTAKDGEWDQADAFDLGADDYLTKPFSFVVLNARLRALARRGATERPAQLTAKGLVLDPATHLVKRGDVSIDLTPREFNLLAYLMQQRGAVVTKAQILDGVWGSEHDGDPNVVEVYVGYLRKKIDAPFGENTIQTVRGVGYRLAME